jgi:hypothetical protein
MPNRVTKSFISECIQDRFLKGESVNTVGFALLKQEYETQCRPAKVAPQDF